MLALGQMAVNGADHVQFLGHLPQRRAGPKLEDPGGERFSHTVLQSLEQPLSGAQMQEHDRAGLAIDPARFDNLPVGVPPGGLFLDGGHFAQCIHQGKLRQEPFPGWVNRAGHCRSESITSNKIRVIVRIATLTSLAPQREAPLILDVYSVYTKFLLILPSNF